MLPIAFLFNRRKQSEPVPRKDVLDEEWEWVYGRKPAREVLAGKPGDRQASIRSDQRGSNPVPHRFRDGARTVRLWES